VRGPDIWSGLRRVARSCCVARAMGHARRVKCGLCAVGLGVVDLCWGRVCCCWGGVKRRVVGGVGVVRRVCGGVSFARCLWGAQRLLELLAGGLGHVADGRGSGRWKGWVTADAVCAGVCFLQGRMWRRKGG